MVRRKKMKTEGRSVRPVLQAGAGRWMLVTCPEGHLLRSIPYGEWSDARKRLGRKKARLNCGKCLNGKVE
jgi:hypothetical protein